MTTGYIRIIAGVWRGRKLKVLRQEGLRPTPNRIRETLFNWLSPHLAGARCLDAFAGSGALGFEALSRGALFVEMVESNPKVIQLLRETAKTLQTEALAIYQGRVPKGLGAVKTPFDIVFLDPPFGSDLLLLTCHYLEDHGFLKPEAKIYLESASAIAREELPANWQLEKTKKAGEVFYHLAVRKKS